MLFPSKAVVATAASLLANLAAAQISNEDITEYFRGNLSDQAEIYAPSDGAWASEVIQRWTIFPPSVPMYVAAIKPATAEDVSAIVCLKPLC